MSELWNPLSNLVQIAGDTLKVPTKTFHMKHRSIDIFWAIENADFLKTQIDEAARRFHGYLAKAASVILLSHIFGIYT